MSPSRRVEIPYLREIIADLQRWAEAWERYIGTIGDQEVGPGWPEQDLIELYQVWLGVGNALRDLMRTQPTADLTATRPEMLAIRDGIRLIADIHTRQA